MQLQLDRVDVILPYIPLDFIEGTVVDEQTYQGFYRYTHKDGISFTLKNGNQVKLEGLVFQITVKGFGELDNKFIPYIELENDRAYIPFRNIGMSVHLANSTIDVSDQNGENITLEVIDEINDEIINILDIGQQNQVNVYYIINGGILS